MSQSQDKSTNTGGNTVTETQNLSLQDTAGYAIAGISGDNTNLNITDGGAIAGIIDIGKQLLKNQAVSTAEALTFSEKASRSALQFAENAGRPDTATYKTQMYVIAGVVVAISVLKFSSETKGKE